MDENMIFKPVNQSLQEAGISGQVPNANPIPSSVPSELPSQPPPSKALNFIKILLGIGVVLGIILMIYNFVLPKLFPAKINQAKIVYWGIFEESSIMDPIISDFESEYPNIKIEYIKQDIKDYKDKLITRSNNGNGPDIFSFHNTWTMQLSDLLLPLPEGTILKEDFSKDFYPVVKTDLIKNGAIYGIPLLMDTLNLYINNDLFKAAGLEAPTTWTEYGDYARQLTVKDENGKIKTSGAAMGTYNNITHAPDIISMLLAQDGVSFQDMTSNVQGVSDALNYYTSFALSDGNVWDETLDQSTNAFASGTLAMYFGYSWDFSTIKSLNPKLSFNVYPVPNLPGKKITIASYWAEGVSSKTKHQKEALTFLQYLTSKDTARRLYELESKKRNFGQPYARISLAENIKDAVSYVFVQDAPTAISSYFVDGTYDNGLNAKAGDLLSSTIDSILKGETPENAAESLSSGIKPILDQYGF